MHKFLTKILLFALLFSFIWCIVEAALVRVPNDYSLKHDKLDKEGDKIDVLVMGHSMAYDGVNPALLSDSAFNCATYGRGIYYDLMMLEEFAPKMPNLKCIIYPVTLFFMDAHPTPGLKVDAKNNLVNRFVKYFGYAPEGGWKYIYWPEVIWNRFDGPIILRLVYGNPLNCDENGWNGLERTGEIRKPAQQKDITDDTEGDQKLKDENIAYLQRFAQICQQRGIRLVLITTPWYKVREDHIEPKLAYMNQCIEAMREVMPSIEYYDYLEDDRFGESDFFDYSHLSNEGANKFTQILAADIFGNDE